MKLKRKWLLITLFILSIFIFAGCSFDLSNNNNNSTTPSGDGNGGSTVVVGDDEAKGSTTEVEVEDDTIDESFTLKNEAGTSITATNNVYTITEAGNYTAKGELENGQIYVNAPNLEVTIELQGLSISNDSVSPIYVNDCDSFTLKVKKDTTNYIYDNRTTDYSNTTTTDGTAAIYVANGNLKISGKGTLYVESTTNSAIHGKDNVSIKNATLLIKGQNNGIKGNDKVTIEENPTISIVAGNNGITTSKSDMGSSAQHGYIYIYGGTITINSYGDGIDAAYAVEINSSTDKDGNTYTPVIDIYTNNISSELLKSYFNGEIHSKLLNGI